MHSCHLLAPNNFDKAGPTIHSTLITALLLIEEHLKMGTITCELESSYAATAGDDKAAKLGGKLGAAIPHEPQRRRMITFAGDGGKGRGRRLGDGSRGGGTPTAAWSLRSLRRRTNVGSGGIQMQVFVRTLAGKSLALDVSPDDTIDAVKARIQAKERVAAADQRLVFAGRGLDDGRRTLDECGVTKEANLYLQLRLRGGAGGDAGCGLTVVGFLAIVVAVGAALSYFPTSPSAAASSGGLTLLFVWGLAVVGVNLITAGVCRLAGTSGETLYRAARSALSKAAAFARLNVAVLGPAAASSAATGIVFSGADPVLYFVCFALFLGAMSLTLFLVFAGRHLHDGGRNPAHYGGGGTRTEANPNLGLLRGGTRGGRGTTAATAGRTAAVGLLVASVAQHSTASQQQQLTQVDAPSPCSS